MSVEKKCVYCKHQGFTCEDPNTLGQPKARIAVHKNGSQKIELKPIEDCESRSAVLEIARIIKQRDLVSAF